MSRSEEFQAGHGQANQPVHPDIWDMDHVQAHQHLLDDHGFHPYFNVDDLRGQEGGTAKGDDALKTHEYIHDMGSDDDGNPAPVLHQHAGARPTQWRQPRREDDDS